jgi:uncharacterized tellurite resistance protein B-like protein
MQERGFGMGLLDWLFGRAPRIEDAYAPPPPVTLQTRRPVPPPPAEDPDEIITVEIPDEDEPLENLFCYLEYEDARGQQTRRPVTFISLTRRFPHPAIFAVCHMRRAVRNFRADRIRAIITADGEVFDGQTFLTDYLKLNLTPAQRVGARPERRGTRNPRPASRDARDLMLAPLTVLVACGKTDGHYHKDEIDRIMSWAEMEALHLFRLGRTDHPLTIDDADALGRVIAGMRPQQRTLRQHMVTTLSMDAEALARFRRALQSVIHADGQTHESEIAFMEEFDALSEWARRDPEGLRREIESGRR